MSVLYSDVERVRNFLQEKKIITLVKLKEILGTTSTMTVYRRLKSLSYLASYSHRGKYYTLPDIPEFNDTGIWSHKGVYFSRYGNLVRTIEQLI